MNLTESRFIKTRLGVQIMHKRNELQNKDWTYTVITLVTIKPKKTINKLTPWTGDPNN